MRIDESRIRQITGHFASLDPLQAYYELNSIQLNAQSTIAPEFTPIIESAFRKSKTVLDIGCGNGLRLISNRHMFQHGAGIDESEYALQLARENLARFDASNVEFILCQANQLPFADQSFDFVFTERGPIGRNDVTLAEAHRVLKSNGIILVETLGSLNLLESSIILDSFNASNETLLTSLEIERERFERIGFVISMLSSIIKSIRFKDFYEWFSWQCSIWRYLERPLPWPSSMDKLSLFYDKSVQEDGSIALSHHLIWIGGRKKT
jgi:ubiquinone/menaquinone biosynthesis C-methylase UbiE